MSRHILGISAFYHDSAAAILADDRIVAAAQEERFSRKRHDPRFPTEAINYCLEEAFIEPEDLEAVVFYDNPLLTWDRVLKTALTVGRPGRQQFEKAALSILGSKVWIREQIEQAIGTLGKQDLLLITEHHMAHAASAFYPSPFQEAAIITLDGVGEWATTTIGRGHGNEIELLQEIRFPHSLGLLYSAFTYFCGFKVNSGEYKLMGLAPYGEPVYYDRIRDNVIDVKRDGSFRLNMRYFAYLDTPTMTSPEFDRLFGGEARQPESRITRREMDLAASIQKVTEDVVLAIAKHARHDTGCPNLVLAGGVALNCVANGKLVREAIFDKVWVQPAAGDAGGALGAALHAAHTYFGVPRKVSPAGGDSQRGSFLGPAFSAAEIRAFLDRNQYPAEEVRDVGQRARKIAQAIAAGNVVGLFSGRMEYGPRALGGRSILGDPRDEQTQSLMNLKIKYRESFRPFAPAVAAEDVSDYFELDCQSPYMLLVAPINEDRRISGDQESRKRDQEDLLKQIHAKRSDLPAVTHVDYSARIQTVNEDDHWLFHRILKEFKELTGYSVLVNTSFNVRGEPIVCTPRDAYLCFMRTEMDLLVLEDHLLWKDQQPEIADNEDWKNTYELD